MKAVMAFSLLVAAVPYLIRPIYAPGAPTFHSWLYALVSRNRLYAMVRVIHGDPLSVIFPPVAALKDSDKSNLRELEEAAHITSTLQSRSREY